MGKQHSQLTLDEREKISILKASGKSLREIGVLIGKHASTLSRELKRNSFKAFGFKGYGPARAEISARKRKSKAAKRTRLKNQQIRDYVTQKLKLFWSPEQIAGRIRLDHPELSISHEAIYQFIYEDDWSLFPFLARKHKRRRLKFNYKKSQGRSIPGRTWISQRPEAVNQRQEFGHWEADSMVSRANSASLHALVERKSRYLKITKIPRNTSGCVRNAVLRRLSPLPKSTRLSITYDNGLENSNHLEINRELKSKSFFCNPYHSWEKGSVENANGLVRRFIPKKTDFQKIPTTEIFQIENLINNRPRKCLNYQTPKEVFKNLSVAIAS
ncbi:MAG TPA: IS30 family transposase [Candidatus Omnitrophota bacterium]|nr:IS30 family transposase [Candidatus Omnitrophota bacterium]